MPASTPATRPPARGRPGHDTESLLAVAVEVFNERGYDATSMEDIARAAGIQKSSIYHHVTGKEELLRRGVSRALDGLFAAWERTQTGGGPALARLTDLLRAEVAVLVGELPYVTLLLRVRGNTATERWALERRRSFDRSVGELVARAKQEGDVRSDVDPALVERLVFGMLNSVVEWYRPGRVEPGELADALVALALRGLQG